MFGRRSLEASDDTRHLLSMLLGYDALEDFGGLVTTAATNLTKAIRQEQDALTACRSSLRGKLAAQPGRLRDGLPLRARVAALAGAEQASAKEIEEACDLANTEVQRANAELAGLLGIEGQPPLSPSGLSDALASAVAILRRPIEQLFPTLAALRVSAPSEGATDTGESLAAAEFALADFERRAAEQIRERMEWRTKETAPGEKNTLLVQAAARYDELLRRCPVCDQSVAGLEVEVALRELKAAPAGLRAGLREFFGDLVEELDRIVPPAIQRLGSRPPAQCLLDDWGRLRQDLGEPIASVVARYDAAVRALAGGLPAVDATACQPMPVDSDPAFTGAAGRLLSGLREARRGLATLRWADIRMTELLAALGRALNAETGETASLHAALASGKNAAADTAPLVAVRDELAAAAKDAAAISAAKAVLATLEEMRTALDEIKTSGKYAEAKVQSVFEGIRERTIENVRKLYPNANAALAPSRLHLNKGRDKSVEAYLAGSGFEIPGQYVANAGLMRAMALAFYFALLDHHPGGLGFVIMDDPILSLDDDHREAWAANVLRPALETTQVILATHQRQFLNNCKSDFRPGRLVELNPRTRSPQITWRPGDRLDRAEQLLAVAWSSAPNEMRKYREDLIITLDAYSPTQVFHPKNFQSSLEAYGKLVAPHPLAGSNRGKLARKLADDRVTRVLDPGSHALTESDVTEPMVIECLKQLRELDQTFQNELERLEAARLKEIRNKAIPSPAPDPSASNPGAVIPLDRLRVGDDDASWFTPIRLTVIGSAAAQTRGCVVEMSELPAAADFPPGGAVLVTKDCLAPVARPGQWALLAEPTEINDGDLVAAIDRVQNRYLRRCWSDGDAWLLEAVNPSAGIAPARLRKCECQVRKILGVSFGPPKEPTPTKSRHVSEWAARKDFSAACLGDHFGITVEGTSLEPLAADGQLVLVRKFEGRLDGVKSGCLAVLETDDDAVGNVIKRVFPQGGTWMLVSPNPTDPRDPIALAKRKLRALWTVRGFLFTFVRNDSEES